MVRLFCLALALTDCSAYDFGAKAPIEVKIDQVNPTWNTGIGLLFAVKCASCHAGGNPMTPGGTPQFAWQNEAVVQANKALIVNEVFTQHSMPPKFGTPLTANELTALRKYLQ